MLPATNTPLRRNLRFAATGSQISMEKGLTHELVTAYGAEVFAKDGI